MSIDGTCLDVADTSANAAHFGYAGNDRTRSAFPQTHLLTLSEVGTHAIVGAAMGPYSTGERSLAHRLGPLVEQGMLVLADAGFYPWQMWHDYAGTGADLAWRVGAGLELPPVQALADGSYTALVFAPRTRRRTKDALIAQARAGGAVDPERARLVRAVDYTVAEANPEGELITVITTVLEPGGLSATELAGAYAQRWEHERALGEVKRGLLGPGAVVSSQTPAMVTAQVYGILLAHYAVRWLMWQAADGAGYGPDGFHPFGACGAPCRRGRCGFFPLKGTALRAGRWWPRSLSGPTRPGATAPTHAGSNGAITTPTASNALVMSLSGTTVHRCQYLFPPKLATLALGLFGTLTDGAHAHDPPAGQTGLAAGAAGPAFGRQHPPS